MGLKKRLQEFGRKEAWKERSGTEKSFGEKVKREAHYMRLGAKVLPKVMGRKVKEAAKGYWEKVKENARLQAEAEKEARQAEREAYKISLVEQAKLRGQAKGRLRASRQGTGGILAQLGQAGERMSLTDVLGMPQGKQVSREIDTGGYMLSGLGQPQQKRQVRVVHHVHHYPHKKKHKHGR